MRDHPFLINTILINTIRIDRLAEVAITCGGVTALLAAFGVCGGALWFAVPLFLGAFSLASEVPNVDSVLGTVVLTLLLIPAVAPLGVSAALYLREYAKPQVWVRVLRLAVRALAGIPSVVLGLFGLGFFCSATGSSIEQLLFAAALPQPVDGVLPWVAAALALLTLPVVIVAAEEAIVAVPGALREGSYACGASRWQTLRRIILPHALPGILIGALRALARGVGEVLPLLLVGVFRADLF